LLKAEETAFVFPGQGSQVTGMGAELAKEYSVARQTFEEADEILGFSLSGLCFEGPDDRLTETVNAQPALYTAGIAALRTLYEEWDTDFKPAFTAGHSLGELTALTASGALSFSKGIRLVLRRGELMRDAGEHSPGGMAALLGAELAMIESICREASHQTGGTAVVANDNCPGQVVIAGDEETLKLAMEKGKKSGAKRVVRLPVSIAAHSPLMARVQEEFRTALEQTTFYPPMIPVMGNTQAVPLTSTEDIRNELGDQLTSPIRWTESVQALLDSGITTFIELGSKNVLTGLLRRIDRQAKGFVVDAPAGINGLPPRE
jgi:[acyl-carrier-protein] S-malonyltransferase